MKLFDCLSQDDFGTDSYLIIGQFSKFNLLDIMYSSSDFHFIEPNLNLTFGLFNGNVISFNLRAWWVSLSINLISYRSPLSLKWFRH